MKNQSVQTWRGISIIAVLLIHLEFLHKSDNNIFLLSRQVLNFAVPLFFFISGYFAHFNQYLNKKGIIRLFVPYIIWTIIYYGIGEYDMVYNGKVYYYDKFNIFEVFCFGYSSMQMYYLIALIELLLFSPVIYRFRYKKWMIGFCIISTPICIVLNQLWNLKFGTNIPYITSMFVFHLTYFYLGLMVRFKQVKVDIKTSTLLFIAFIAIYAGVIESNIYLIFNPKINAGPYRLSAFIFCICLIAIAYKEFRETKAASSMNFLSIIGDYSFFIYLSHILLFRVGYYIMEKILSGGAELQFEILKDTIIVTVTISISITICKISEKLLPAKMVKWLGIK